MDKIDLCEYAVCVLMKLGVACNQHGSMGFLLALSNHSAQQSWSSW